MSVFPDVVVGTNYSVPPNFDPLEQPLYFLLKNGTLFTPITFNQMDANFFFDTQWSVVYGSIIGAAFMTLLHVLALTPVTKRRTLIYWLNIIGLCEVMTRGILDCLFFTRDRYETGYVYYTGDSTSVPVLHRVHSSASVVLSLCSIATVEIIFFVQGRAILSSVPRRVYLPLMAALVSFGVVAVTVRLIYAVYNLQDIWVWNHVEPGTEKMPKWCEPATLISYVITIGAWSFVWTCFIGRQIFLRWRMNIMRGKSFGAMNVLFLAGIQSMILPLFFLILQFIPASKTFYGSESLVVPCVLCLMPFSCLWAGTISSANGQGCDEPARAPPSTGNCSSKIPFARFFSSGSPNSSDHNNTGRTLSGATATGHDNALCPVTSNHLDKLYPELRDEDHIAVTQTYTVHSDQSSRNGSAV